VSFPRRDPFARRHPALVVAHDGYLEVRREGERCAALAEDNAGRYACAVYADRPRPCREFPVAGESCLLARRRVGLAATGP
jgi:Fe-S-cluster containining protein